MSDTQPVERVKRSYVRRDPIRKEELRASETRPDEVRPKKVRTRKGGGTDPLNFLVRNPELIPEGIDLQWVTSEVLGQPAVGVRQSYEVNAWEPVTGDMFGGRFDGMFHPKGHKGEINVGGLVLMYRPMELTLEARAEEREAAVQPLRTMDFKLKTGAIDGVSLPTDHPSARNNTYLKREMHAPIPVPKD